MPETLLNPSRVLLYGRVLEDLRIDHDRHHPDDSNDRPPSLGSNRFLKKQLGRKDACFARIYGFSYEGHYYDLSKPTIFLVHGSGVRAEMLPGETRPASRLARAPADANLTGTASRTGSFSDDIRVWAYDKADLSLCMDVDSGSLEEILLEAELRTDRLQAHYSGEKARMSPAKRAKIGD